MISCSYQKKQESVCIDLEIKGNIPVVTSSLDTLTQLRIDEFILSRSRYNNLSGAFLFAKGDKFYANAFGKARYLNGKDVQVKDVFQLASVSKLITSLCVLKLVEEGVLNLSDTVGNLIPNFNYRDITIHQLLTHTSGLPEYTYLTDRAWFGDYSTKCNQDAYHVLNESGQPAYFNPGRRFNYRNTNYMLLAYIVELKTELSFPDIVTKYITKPAGLDSLHVYEKDKRTIKEYPVWGMRGNRGFIPGHSLNHICGDKSIYANVYDLFTLYKALMEDKILNEQSRKLLLTPYIQVKRSNPQFYCYGLRKVELNSGVWYFHNGWWHGYRSYFWFNPKKNQCAILLTNRLKGGFVNTKEMISLLED
jgi:CubicO group peptidase (beta-lactamase class C family)